MRIKNSNANALSAILLTLVSGLAGCRTNSPASEAKDITLSPSNLSEPLAVIWEGTDNKVHYALCPASPASRTCAGIDESVSPVPIADYRDKLTSAILNLRPKAVNSANMTYSEINLLRTKIKRLNVKISAGGLSATELANFNAQLTKYNTDLQTLSTLTSDEQKTFDLITNSLKTNQDVTLDEGEENFLLAMVPFGLGLGVMSNLPLPPPGTTGNRIEIEKLVDAWKEAAEMFYGPNPTGYRSGTRDSPVGILQEPISSCLGACPQYFSDLTCHFYCWHPSYKYVSPNVRGCFTSIARDSLVKKPNGQPLNLYPEVFDYCMYQEFDQAFNTIPAYDENLIAQRKSSNRAGDRVGVIRYMTKKQEDAFKYVMFNWYNPFAFDEKDEREVIDKFYASQPGVAPSIPHQVSRTNKGNHPRYAQILPFMQQQYASGGFGAVPAGAGSATVCAGGGTLVDGYCWHYGALGESCDTTCSNAGLTADTTATINYIGSGGSDLFCGRIAASFGESYSGKATTKFCPANGCAKCDGTCSAPLTNAVYRCTGAPTSTAGKSASSRPFCACN
jgi:hypothetical protein